jgi:hypothetical protein
MMRDFTIFWKLQLWGSGYFWKSLQKNPEADDLIAAEGGKSFKDEYAAAEFVLFLTNEDNEEELGKCLKMPEDLSAKTRFYRNDLENSILRIPDFYVFHDLINVVRNVITFKPVKVKIRY